MSANTKELYEAPENLMNLKQKSCSPEWKLTCNSSWPLFFGDVRSNTILYFYSRKHLEQHGANCPSHEKNRAR